MTARREIFKNLYLTYSSSLYVYARRFVESPQVREDIVCDVFARLWLKGDPTCLDIFHEPKMHAFNGLLTVIVQASEVEGDAVLTVKAMGLKSATMKIQVK